MKYFNDNFESVKSDLDTAYNWVSGASQNVKDIINDAASQIEAALGDTYSDMKDWFENAGANIDSAIANALESGGAILEQIADSLSGYATQTWVNAQDFVSDIVSEISSNASSVIDALQPGLDGIYQTISGLTSQIASQINTALQPGSVIFNNIVSSVSATVSDIVDLVSANADDVADSLRSSLDSVYVNANDFTSKINDWLDESAQAGLKFFNDLSSSARNAIAGVSNWYSGLSISVRNAIDDAVNWYNGLSSSVKNGISSAVSWYDSASGNVKNIISSASSEVANVLGSVWNWLKNLTQPSQTMIGNGKIWADDWAVYPASQSVNMSNHAITGIHFLRLTNINADSISNGDIWLNGKRVKVRTNDTVVDLTEIGSSGGVSALDDLSDVNIGNPSTNTVLKYFNGQWVDGQVTNSNIASVSASKITGAFDDVEINGDLNHDGSRIGFYGVAPVTRREQAYNPSATLSNLISR